MKVTVTDIYDLNAPQGLRCYASVTVGPVTFHKCRYVQQLGQRPYVQPPQQEWLGPDNRVRYTPLVTWPDDWKQPITDAVRAAFLAQRPAADAANK